LAGLCVALSIALSVCARAQTPAPTHGPAEALYRELRSVGLDKARVYSVRELAIDRSSIHISLDNGIIAFTEDVAGHVTGAFFQGEGELLLSPPNRVERASLALFTGAAILEERFETAYFRFNDNTFADVQGSLNPPEEAQDFAVQWNETARNLAPLDALRLLVGFTGGLSDPGSASTVKDVLWHARLHGRKLGTFDVYYDSTADEQVWAGQAKISDAMPFFDLWCSFTPGGSDRSPASSPDSPADNVDFDAARYKIRVDIKMPTQLSADTTLEMNVRNGGQRAVLFELSRFLQVQSVEADGQPVEFIHNPTLEGSDLARRGDDQIAVIFPKPLRTGQKVVLRFVYSGDVLSDAGGGLVYVGARGTWYPNRRPILSNFDLEFHYPAGWTLIATGRRVDELGAKAETGALGAEQVSRWESERPLPVAGFNLGKYEKVEAKAGEVKIGIYASRSVEETFPQTTILIDQPAALVPSLIQHERKSVEVPLPQPSPARNAQQVADQAARAVEFFAWNFGPYPYGSLSLTQRPGVMSQGWPGLVFLSSYSFLTDAEKTQIKMGQVERILSTNVIAHEIAHQWWGDLVTWGGYRDQWLVEALSDYSSLMLTETSDELRFRSVLNAYRDHLLQKNRNGEALMVAGPVTLGSRLSNSHFPGGYETISYGRGVWMFHMLRNMLRDATRKTPDSDKLETPDEPFVRALRSIRERYAGRAITTQGLLAAFEDNLPRPLWHEDRKSLDWFFESWVNGTAIPRFDVRDVKLTVRGAGFVVTGTISEKDAPDNLVTPVPVYAVMADKRNVFLGQVFVDEPETHFRLSAPVGTRKVLLDPYRTLLTRDK
jgi:hypothetical protein